MFKDKDGKTPVHSINCPYLGSKDGQFCKCPKRLAFGTVQSLVGQLKSIFENHGRGRVWNETLCMGNPAASNSLRN